MATSQSTLPDSDEDKNIGQRRSDELFDKELTPSPAQVAAQDQEEAAKRELNGGLYEASPGGKKGPSRLGGRVRKSSPVVALVTLVFGAGLGFSAFFSPSLLLIHMKEIMVDKFNISVTSAEARTTRVINAQIDDTTTGFCGARITLRCKFSTMSKVQVDNFRNAGIGVIPDTPNGGFNRTKPTGYIFKGQTVTPSQFATLSNSDPSFKSALRQAYNPKFAGFWGKAWNRTATLFGTGKAKVDLSGEDDAARAKKLQSFAKVGDAEAGRLRTAADFKNDTDCNASCAETKAADANKVINEVGDDTKNGDPGRRLTSALSGGAGEGLANTVKATGVLDTYCGAYATIRAIGYAGKTIRAVQLARYAMAFYNVTDELVATGNVEPETMAFMAGILTEVTYDVSTTTREILRGSATDSLGFKYAQFGDTTSSTRSMNIASRFIAGGGFAGDLIQLSNAISDNFPGGRAAAAETCGFLANPFVQGGSVIAGLALLAVPGVNVAKVVVQGAVGITASIGLAILPTLLADAVAGTITENIVGEEAGNAIASGSEAMMADRLSQFAGNPLVTKAEASVYLSEHEKTIAMYAEEDRRTKSPFDPTSRHTFVGSMVSNMLPAMSSANTPSGLMGSFGSILATSVNSLVPKTKAESRAQIEATLDACQDEESQSAGYATGLFCNPLRGMPLKYLDKSPITVVTELIRDGYLDAQTELPTQRYTDFVSECIETANPPGYSNDADAEWFSVDDARNCMVSDSNANIFLSYQDTLIADGLAGEDVARATNPASTKQELAQKIIAKGNITYGPNASPKLEDIADGSVDPDALPCGININILRAIDAITDEHSIRITSINRKCIERVFNGFTASRHYSGNGSGLDIDLVDGGPARGRDAGSLNVLRIVMPIISEAALSVNSFAQIGQRNCGGGAPAAIEGIRYINDGCNHFHLDVPASSDPDLQFLQGGQPSGGRRAV